jgi:hypothetical protein
MHNLSARVVYKSSDELYNLIEGIKAIEYVTRVQWSEVAEVIGDNNSEVISAFLTSKDYH